MKTYCRSCGVHFPTDFEETLHPECTYWKSLGFPDTFPVEDRKVVWDWFFALNRDDIGIRTGVSVDVQMQARKATVTGNTNDFDILVPGYITWPEEKRIQYQKDLSKFAQQITDTDRAQFLIDSFAKVRPDYLV